MNPTLADLVNNWSVREATVVLLEQGVTTASRLARLRRSAEGRASTRSAQQALEEHLGSQAETILNALATLTCPIRPGTDSSHIEALLKSTELDELVRMLVTAVRRDLDQSLAELLQRASIDAATRYLGDDAGPVIGEVLFAQLRASTKRCFEDRRLHQLLEQDPDSISGSLLHLQLDKLSDHIASLSAEARTSREELLKHHRAQMALATEMIEPPELSRRKVPIDAIYVPPSISGVMDSIDDLIGRMGRMLPGCYVILGDPGAGKTSITRYLSHRIIAGDWPLRSVVTVTLRHFEEWSSSNHGLIATYIAANEREQRQIAGTEAQWDNLLKAGSVAVVFDGLDELIQVPRRQSMASIIEGFVVAYPHVPVVVTCRVQGYSEAALRTDLFGTIRILPFSDGQSGQYVRNWYALDGNVFEGRTPAMCAEMFLTESDAVKELRSNPLLLSLLCLLYNSQGYIPDNLADVYHACTELLFSTWDERRQIKISRVTTRLRRLVEDIAWWMYSASLNEVGVSESALVDFCADRLIALKTNDANEATELAEEFIDHCRGRAWVFSDGGLSGARDRRFSFAHRSFLEYFAAKDLARRLEIDPGSDGLAQSEFEDIVLATSGDLVPILTLQVMEAGAADRVLESTFTQGDRYLAEMADVVAEFLKEVLLRVDLHERVLKQCLERVFEAFLDDPPPDAITNANSWMFAEADIGASVIVELLEARSENWPAIVRSIMGYFSAPDTSGELTDVAAKRASVATALLRKLDPLTSRRAEQVRSLASSYVGSIASILNALNEPREYYFRFGSGYVLPAGSLAGAWTEALLGYRIGGPDGTVLASVSNLLLGRRVWTVHAANSIPIFEVVAGGSAALPISTLTLSRALDRTIFDLDDAVDITSLESEDFRYESFAVSTRWKILSLLHAAARKLNHPSEEELASSLLLSCGIPRERSMLLAADRSLDVLSYVRRQGKGVASELDLGPRLEIIDAHLN